MTSWTDRSSGSTRDLGLARPAQRAARVRAVPAARASLTFLSESSTQMMMCTFIYSNLRFNGDQNDLIVTEMIFRFFSSEFELPIPIPRPVQKVRGGEAETVIGRAALGARGSALAACASAERCGAALSSEDLDAEIRAIKRQQKAHEQPWDVEASASCSDHGGSIGGPAQSLSHDSHGGGGPPARLRGGARAPDEKMFNSAHPPGGLESVYGSYSWLRQNISYVAVEYAYAA